jgi:hypothetical protein
MASAKGVVAWTPKKVVITLALFVFAGLAGMAPPEHYRLAVLTLLTTAPRSFTPTPQLHAVQRLEGAGLCGRP